MNVTFKVRRVRNGYVVDTQREDIPRRPISPAEAFLGTDDPLEDLPDVYSNSTETVFLNIDDCMDYIRGCASE